MKIKLFIFLALSIAFTACKKDNSVVTPTTQKTNSAPPPSSGGSRGWSSSSSYNVAMGLFLDTATANTMISSYVTSINNAQYSGNIKSFTIDADSLRAYLSNHNVRNVKLIFGHTMNYIISGNQGVYCGMQAGALDLIIAGFDDRGNYVYFGSQQTGGPYVLDHMAPCPWSCPAGAAGNDLLQ